MRITEHIVVSLRVVVVKSDRVHSTKVLSTTCTNIPSAEIDDMIEESLHAR